MKKILPTCICLQEVMLENTEYMGMEYESYAAVTPDQRSKGRIAITVREKLPHKRLTISTTLQVVVLEVYLAGKGKKL